MKRQVQVGRIPIGGEAPVSIQSMTNTNTTDVVATVSQILALEKAGCDIVRVAVPDETAAAAVYDIKKEIHIPLVCDIHFDYRLAISAMEHGADKIRINPGNIGDETRVKAVVDVVAAGNIPIRVGVNSGSLEKDLVAKYGGVTAEALVESALKQVALLEKLEFHNMVISLKSSSVPMNTAAYRLIHEKTEYPLHIGVTEAGTPSNSIIKSSVGLGALLLEGIGDTMRVSMTGDPVDEVIAAKKILAACGLRKEPIEIIACPTCGRTKVELLSIVDKVEKAVAGLTPKKKLQVAIMGCAVNGPGEAKEADIGVACGPGKGLLFRQGEIVKRVPEEDIVSSLVAMIKEQ